jgi:hypothetical protein
MIDIDRNEGDKGNKRGDRSRKMVEMREREKENLWKV